MSRFVTLAARALDRVRMLWGDCGGGDHPTVRYAEPLADPCPLTPDQAAIEVAIGPLLQGCRVLHVGTGDAGFAMRHARSVAHIDSITVRAVEVDAADCLRIPNHRALLLDKYSVDLAKLPGNYDLVIDNNPTSFACCNAHARRMFAAYAALLAPNGMIVTHRRGAEYRQRGGFKLTEARWRRQVRAVGLRPDRLDADVWTALRSR